MMKIKMRVVAGKYKSRKLILPDKKVTRPVMDFVKEKIFNIIGPLFDGGECLDLFFGSGSLGIEAFSRGITKVYGSEIDKCAYLVALKNIKNLNLEKDIFLINKDYKELLKEVKQKKFKLIFIDPPYKTMLGSTIIKDMFNLVDDGFIVVFSSREEVFLESEKLYKKFTKGACTVRIYKI